MAARLNKRHQDFVREKIKSSQLINSLQKHIDGERELSSSQVQATKILLDKSLSNAPTLNETDMNVSGGLTWTDMTDKEMTEKIKQIKAEIAASS